TMVNLTGTFNQADQAVGLTRALWITPEEGAQQFGQVTRMGLDQDRFAKKLAEETAAAQMRGRMGEMTSTLIGMADELTQRLGRVPDQDALTGLLGRLSAQGVPGLQGAYGAARVQSIDEAFRGQSLFNLPNLGPLAEFQMFSTMGVRDPVKMWQMQQQGLMAHPEMWKGMFGAIDKMGGFNSITGFGAAMALHLPPNEEAFNAIRKATTQPEAPGLAGFLQERLGPEEYGKLDFLKTPQMFEVARQFQAREKAGEFRSAEEEGQQLIATLQKEGATMA